MNLLHLAAAICALGTPANNDTVLLDFGADWCGYCRQMEPVVGQLAAQGFPVRKVNVDKEHALAEKYGVQGLPCFVMLVGGKEVDRVVGATDRGRLEAMFHRNGVEPGTTGVAPARRRDCPRMKWRQFRFRPPIQRGPIATGGLRRKLSRSIGGGKNELDAAASANDSPFDQLIRASVRLRIEDHSGVSCGSGTIIDSRQGEALILTCGHMFREADKDSQIMVDMFGPGAPQAVPGRLIDYDLKSEVGLLSIEVDFPVTVAHLAPAGYAIRKGDHVISVGCDGGEDATAKETVIKSINRYGGPANLQIGFQPVQGRSGGGLFTPEGLVIGVCNAGDPQDNEGEFSHLSVVEEMLDRNGLAFAFQDQGRARMQGAGRRWRQEADTQMQKAEGGRRSRAPLPRHGESSTRPSPKGRGRMACGSFSRWRCGNQRRWTAAASG